MSKIEIIPTKLNGSVTAPPSKSAAHRAIIAVAFSQIQSETASPSIVRNFQMSEDMEATLNCVRNLGCGFEYNPQRRELSVFADKTSVKDEKIYDCGESGSTLRFFIPIALVIGGKSTFTGRGRLLARPQTPYFEIFDKLGINYSHDSEKIVVDGQLTAGEYQLRGDISSQFVTGLLFALALADGESRITMTTPLASRGYVDLTLQALADFGITVKNDNYETFTIKGGQAFIPRDYHSSCRSNTAAAEKNGNTPDNSITNLQKSANSNFIYTVEGDYSQAAFWLVAAAIGNNVECNGLNPSSLQGDKQIVDIIGNAKNYVNKAEDGDYYYVNIDVDEIPDLVPILAVLCSLSHKKTKLINAARLRIKESDRLNAIATELNKLGAKITEGADFLEIDGVDKFTGGAGTACLVSAHNDHRIAMALAIAATRAEGNIIIDNAECVKKSYPDFWEDYQSLGGKLR